MRRFDCSAPGILRCLPYSGLAVLVLELPTLYSTFFGAGGRAGGAIPYFTLVSYGVVLLLSVALLGVITLRLNAMARGSAAALPHRDRDRAASAGPWRLLATAFAFGYPLLLVWLRPVLVQPHVPGTAVVFAAVPLLWPVRRCFAVTCRHSGAMASGRSRPSPSRCALSCRSSWRMVGAITRHDLHGGGVLRAVDHHRRHDRRRCSAASICSWSRPCRVDAALVVGALRRALRSGGADRAHQDLKLRQQERRRVRAVKRWFGWSGLLLASCALAADDAALRAVETCRARLDPRADVGIERIQKRCPDLLPALASAPWRDLLPQRHARAARGNLGRKPARARRAGTCSRGGEARRVTRRAARTSSRCSPSSVRRASRARRAGNDFKRWLKEKLENRKDDDDRMAREDGAGSSRPARESRRPSPTWAMRWLAYWCCFVIWSELARGWAARRHGSRRGRRSAAAAQWRRRLMLADVAAAPLAERPGMLLRLLGEALTRAQRLPAAEGLTAATIVRRAGLDSEQDRADLAHVATTAEQCATRDSKPPDDRLERSVAAAQEPCSRNLRVLRQADADARAGHHFPAGARCTGGVLRVCGCVRLRHSIRMPIPRGPPPPSGAAMDMPACSNGCRVPVSKFVPCASATPR